jgi:polyhydroxybutyrate depolymerase
MVPFWKSRRRFRTNTRKIVIGAVLVFIGLPVVLVLIVAVSFYVLNRTNGTIVSSGQKREYLLYVPKSYDRAKPTPLVISLHGAAMWPAAQMETSQWNKVADEHDFIVVYPSGTGVPRIWGSDRADVRFISDLIDRLEAAYSIDPTRIYVNGFSNGGEMAFMLSCTLSNRIAAVGTVAPALLLPWSWCADSRPMPIITFHGTADRLAPYNGGPSLASPPRFIASDHGKSIPFASVSTIAANWARRNQCGPNPVESVVTADVTRLEYTHCADDAAVVLYTVQGGGHSWPGGKPMVEWFVGPTSRSIDASSQMWAFFREHPLRRK